MQSKLRFRVQKALGGGHLSPAAGCFNSLREAANYCLSQGDGNYYVEWLPSELVGPSDSPEHWTYSHGKKLVSVVGGKLAGDSRTGTARLLHASGRLPQKIQSATLYVVRPGNLTEEGSLHSLGTCVVRTPLPGDSLLDTLPVKVEYNHEQNRWELNVYSARQRESHQYRFTDKGPAYEPERKTFDYVSLSGRAAAWGSLGDDTYDEDSADQMAAEIFREAVLGAKWRAARVYWDATEKPQYDGPDQKQWMAETDGLVLSVPFEMTYDEISEHRWLGHFADLIEREDYAMEPITEPEPRPLSDHEKAMLREEEDQC